MTGVGSIAELSGVCFSYPDSDVEIRELSFEVHRGERLAVVGPNGAGKTTLLRLLSGLLVPDRGRVRVCGLDPARSNRRAIARKVAVVGQQATIGFPYTALEVVLMGRAPHVDGFRLESGHDLEVARRAMAATGVSAFEARSFDTLSSGERQRVAIARALAQEPELLLLDEPAAFLDIRQQTALYDLLASLNRDAGVTVVSVLHDLNLVSLYFDRVAMLAVERSGGGETHEPHQRCEATARGGVRLEGRVSGVPGNAAQAGAGKGQASSNRGACRRAVRRLHAIGSPEEVLTYQAIREVFETDVYVSINDLTGKLNVLPLPNRRKS